MGVIDWPTQPFYIQSWRGRKHNRANAMVVKNGIADGIQIVFNDQQPAGYNLWIALPLGKINGVEVASLVPCDISNPSSTTLAPGPYAATCNVSATGEISGRVGLAPLDPTDAGQWFVLEQADYSGASKIRSYVDSDQYFYTYYDDDIYWIGMAPYVGNEPNQFTVIVDEGQLVAQDMTFGDLAEAGKIADGQGSSVLVDNKNGTKDLDAVVTLQYTTTDQLTDTFSSETTLARTISSTVGLTGTISKALSINVSGTVSETSTQSTTFGQTKTTTKTEVYTQQLTVTVPPSAVYTYSLIVKMGLIANAPTTIAATFYSSMPGANDFPVTIPGSYSGAQLVEMQISKVSEADRTEDRFSIPLPYDSRKHVLVR